MWATNFYGYSKNILVYTNCRLSKIRSLHTYVMYRMFYFERYCISLYSRYNASYYTDKVQTKFPNGTEPFKLKRLSEKNIKPCTPRYKIHNRLLNTLIFLKPSNRRVFQKVGFETVRFHLNIPTVKISCLHTVKPLIMSAP